MRPAALRRSGWLAATLAGLALAACTAAPADAPTLPANTLPPPAVYTTRRPPASATPPPITSTPWPDSLAGLARAAHGARLIDWIRIPAINVFAPVIPVGWGPAQDGSGWLVWDSPEAQVGWAVSSALPGEGGNIILYGHNNLHSSVFLHLADLKPGDEVRLTTGEGEYGYTIQAVDIHPVPDPQAEQELYERYFQRGTHEALTLLSCWPPTNNTHRVLVSAALR